MFGLIFTLDVSKFDGIEMNLFALLQEATSHVWT